MVSIVHSSDITFSVYANRLVVHATPKPGRSVKRVRKPRPTKADRPRSVCDVCHATLARYSDLERHMKKHQPGADQQYQCQITACGFSSYRKDKLTAHTQARHRGVPA